MIDATAADPWESHFADPNDNELSKRLKAINAKQWSLVESRHSKEVNIGRVTCVVPGEPSPSHKRKAESPASSVADLHLKKRLVEPASKLLPRPSAAQTALAPHISSYQDILYGGRTPENADEIRNLTCLHTLNHVFKTRDRVIKNTSKANAERHDDADASDIRDQGFTRPKVLILLETRQACVRYMQSITTLADVDEQENKKRFQDTFEQAEGKHTRDMPPDFLELFDGNDDNDFRLGIKFTRKTVKYFSQFYNSDIMLASPLGLRRAIKADDPKHMDYDFLSSIEILVVDQAHAMLMQNWEHVDFCLEHLNLQPREAHGCDFSRVRQWYLDKNAKFLRQTLVFSAYITPELNQIFSTTMQNVAGKVKIQPDYTGSMLDINVAIRQTFSRYASPSMAADADERFKYFTTSMLPALARAPQPAEGGLGALIFIPSYLDFVRVRNYFAGNPSVQDLTFGAISEYTEAPEVRRGRSHFLTGRHAVLLYTGRAHHFHRYRIRGVKRILMYGLPDNPIFYTELVGGMLGGTVDEGKVHASDASVRVLFSKWDGLALERIVGSSRARKMLKDTGGDTFDFR